MGILLFSMMITSHISYLWATSVYLGLGHYWYPTPDKKMRNSNLTSIRGNMDDMPVYTGLLICMSIFFPFPFIWRGILVNLSFPVSERSSSGESVIWCALDEEMEGMWNILRHRSGVFMIMQLQPMNVKFRPSQKHHWIRRPREACLWLREPSCMFLKYHII